MIQEQQNVLDAMEDFGMKYTPQDYRRMTIWLATMRLAIDEMKHPGLRELFAMVYHPLAERLPDFAPSACAAS
jgi:hypothetical protein